MESRRLERHKERIRHHPIFRKYISISENKKKHPKVECVKEELMAYACYVLELDDLSQPEELATAVKKVGSGCSLDGIRSDNIRILPVTFLQCILLALQRVFVGDYPKHWEIQTFKSIAKDGQSSKNSKLRGIGIAKILGYMTF